MEDKNPQVRIECLKHLELTEDTIGYFNIKTAD